MSRQSLPCPKCGAAFTRLVQEDQHIVQRCLCGLTKYLLFVTNHGVEIVRRATPVSRVKLTAPGTVLHKCLLVIAQEHPRPVTTSFVATNTNLTSKKSSSALITLMARALVVRVEARRGKIGGSTWKLSTEAIDLLGIVGRDLMEDYYEQ